jgi:hypothetical protein
MINYCCSKAGLKNTPARNIKGYPFLILALIFLLLSLNAYSQSESAKGHIPVIDSEWQRICKMPCLDSLQGPDPEKQHIVDHGFLKRSDNSWLLWACIRGTAPGRILYGWEGASLYEGPWKPIGVVARASSEWDEKTNPEAIQAPYFLKADSGYYCFYNSNGIRLMFSSDGKEFKRVEFRKNNNLLYSEGGRDVMVLKENGTYYAYSTVSTVAGDGWKRGFVILRTSENLRIWSDYTIVSEGGIAGNGVVSAESPFVIKIENYYYLFRSSSISLKTYVYRSSNPYNFGVNDDSKLIATLPVKAPEIIYENGQYYISDLADFQGIKLARLKWKEE